MRADRRLYLNRDQSRLVDEVSAEAKWLLAATGQEIPAEAVKRLDLRVRDGRVVQGPEPEPMVKVSPEEVAASVTEMQRLEFGSPPEPIMPSQSRRSRRKY